MPYLVRLVVASVLMLAGSASLGLAQKDGTTVTLTVSPSFIAFDLGSGFAAVARGSVSRDITRQAGVELSAFLVAPIGGASAQADCVPGAHCPSYATPRLLGGVALAGYAFVNESPLRLVGGVGAVNAAGGEGLAHRGSAAALAGVEWVARGTRRIAPTIGIRLALLARPLAGARQLILPAVGLSF